jgi:exodeoxyribonuclease VII small subunit
MSKVKSLSFEERLAELEGLVEQIESGNFGLNESVEKYSKAQELIKELSEMLSEAKEKLTEEDLAENEEEE